MPTGASGTAPQLKVESSVIENLGLVGFYTGRAIGNVVLFAWLNDRGPFNGGAPIIDAKHREQGASLMDQDRSLERGVVQTRGSVEGSLVVGYYTAEGRSNWITLVNVPNTGPGGPRGWIRVTKDLDQLAGDGGGAYTFPSTNIQVIWRENDNSVLQMFFRFE